MSRMLRCLFIVMMFPIGISFAGCDDNEPRIVEETEEGQFRKLAEDAAAGTADARQVGGPQRAQ